MLGKLALNIGDGGAIRQFGGDAPGFALPARQISDAVVDMRFRASDDHRAPAVIDDVDRDLPTDAGTAADDNDFLGLKMHIRGRFHVKCRGRSHRLRHRPRCPHASEGAPFHRQ